MLRGPPMNRPRVQDVTLPSPGDSREALQQAAVTLSDEFQSPVLKMGGKILPARFCWPQDINKQLELPVAELRWTEFIDEVMRSAERHQSIMHQRTSYLPTDASHCRVFLL